MLEVDIDPSKPGLKGEPHRKHLDPSSDIHQNTARSTSSLKTLFLPKCTVPRFAVLIREYKSEGLEGGIVEDIEPQIIQCSQKRKRK